MQTKNIGKKNNIEVWPHRQKQKVSEIKLGPIIGVCVNCSK